MKEKELDTMKNDNNLKDFFKENIEEVTKRIIELYEYQENVKFVNTKIVNNPQ